MSTLDELRKTFEARGSSSIKGIGRAFRIADDDGSGELSLYEFCKVTNNLKKDFFLNSK